ncbi:hypothetical protein ACFVUS_31035 [Nocardia sp. NPDC058058]|uniref:hypothetical protein n=1 Tax=Nocardia sp. NPDC058058 TaxID=3346317 RepID=UPI0036DA79BD
MFLTAAVAASVTACGGSGPDSAHTTSTPAARTTCDAAAANGSVITSEPRAGVPFTLRLPDLRGWEVTPPVRADSILRLADRHVGRAGNPSVTFTVSAPRSANMSMAYGMQGNWKQWRTEEIQLCRLGGNRASGILVASGPDQVDRYREFLDLDYRAGDLLYPIRMMVDTPAADRDLYQPDIDTFVDGLQIIPT